MGGPEQHAEDRVKVAATALTIDKQSALTLKSFEGFFHQTICDTRTLSTPTHRATSK